MQDFETFLEPLFAAFKAQRRDSETFGDFCARERTLGCCCCTVHIAWHLLRTIALLLARFGPAARVPAVLRAACLSVCWLPSPSVLASNSPAIAPQLSPTAGVGFDALRAAQASYIAPAAAAALPKVTGAWPCKGHTLLAPCRQLCCCSWRPPEQGCHLLPAAAPVKPVQHRALLS